MPVVVRSRFCPDSVFKYAQIGIGAAIGMVFLFFIFDLLSPQTKPSLPIEISATTSLAVNHMLTGPLALKENKKSPLALSMEKKIVLLTQSMRPGLKEEEKFFCLGINGTSQKKIVKEKQKIFFQWKEHPSGGVDFLEFTETSSGLSLAIQGVEDNFLLCHLEQGAGEKIEVLIKPVSSSKSEVGCSEALFLQKAKFWGIDLFFQKYGGSEYRVLGQKQKLEIGEANQNYMLFVSAKDFLSFHNGKWQVVPSLAQANRSMPLAYVHAVLPNQIELEVWDEKGFSLFRSLLTKEVVPAIRVMPDQLLANAKLRNAKQVSCHMAKKRCLLKQGDWFIKTKIGWHKVVSALEIEALLNQSLRGELVIIDSIDQKGVLKGHYFDEMHTHMHPLSLVIPSVDKKKTHLKKKAFLLKT